MWDDVLTIWKVGSEDGPQRYKFILVAMGPNDETELVLDLQCVDDITGQSYFTVREVYSNSLDQRPQPGAWPSIGPETAFYLCVAAFLSGYLADKLAEAWDESVKADPLLKGRARRSDVFKRLKSVLTNASLVATASSALAACAV